MLCTLTIKGEHMNIQIRENTKARQLIREKFRTQEIFSVVSGLDEGVISKILRGIRQPTNTQKEVFERFLGVSAGDLFDYER
jgi:hypothetical protein